RDAPRRAGAVRLRPDPGARHALLRQLRPEGAGMSHDFLERAAVLRETVLTYFASYPDEAVVTPRPNLPGGVDVELSGQLAARFDSVSVAQRGGSRLLRLLFHRDYAAIAPEYELVAPGSPVLRIMQNDLAGHSAFTRSAVPVNVAGDVDDLRVFGFEV